MNAGHGYVGRMRGVGGVCEMCMWLGAVYEGWIRGLGLGFNNHVGTGGALDVCLCFSCGGVGAELVGGLDSLCRWHIQVSVYCARRIPTNLRCIQCSILLHPIDICFLPCICVWQISQIQTCVCVLLSDLDLSRHHPPL